MKIDPTDAKILELLQEDGAQSAGAIGEAVGLTQNPCWKRIRRLEDAGVITGRVALVDAAKVGMRAVVFVSVRTNQHSEDWLENFSAAVSEIPEVVEFYRMSGNVDYLLKVLVADISDYDRIYKRLTTIPGLFDVSSSFAMEQIKYTTAVPVRTSDASGFADTPDLANPKK